MNTMSLYTITCSISSYYL